ncbi:response regulator [[Clostridium] bifermentans ATCC 638]|uniref:Stage 0 sporulation protein A homolog n=1 Tax=Paraclostridium bifermentans ATCC 638 = DSM 14991 TaxID=1233171 RepID=T4VK96_PARBF|nr:response regulator [Paraclostridium bifermentans]EQK41918.1 response regulator [[Clostridium] bifermentans ATCC 638] [Paraclostridium bifermentans ATCC 638 = DSM 14991]UAG18794.1 response regulator [Paraclostridium bifermentans]
MYKLYLLDDEPFILEGLKYIIDWEEYGFDVVGTSSNGEDGFNFIKNEDVDLIITDIMMPKMTGLELINNLKKIKHNAKFIVLSAFQEFQYAKEAISMGAENYLTKPIDEDELIQTIEEVKKKIEKIKLEKVDTKIFKNDLILKLICNKNNDGVLDRLKLEGVNLNYKSLCVVIVEFAEGVNINNLILNHIDNLDYEYCVNLQNQILIIMDKESLSKDILRNLKDDLSRIANEHVYISRGKFVDSIYTLNCSYQSAKDIHEYKLVYPNISWIREYKEKSYNLENIDYIDFDHLKKLLLNKDNKEALTYIESIFSKLKNDENLTVKQIKTKSIEVFLNVYNYFNDSKIIKGLDLYLEKVINSVNLDQIQIELNNMIKHRQSKLEETDDSISPIILKLLRNIEKNYSKDLNLKEISETYNINSIYLGQLFQKETGILFSDYLNNFRVNKAKNLLVETSLKAAEIGELVGYANKNYFYRKFKDIVGITPSEWRKINL